MSDIIDSLDTPGTFCAEFSLEAREPMFGTAPVVDAWLLLEYQGPWTAKATDDNDLPQTIQEWLAKGLDLATNGRVQFIKQSRPEPADGITMFVAVTREIAPLLYEFHFDTYGALYSLDLPALLSGAAVYEQYIRAEPLYLVCTNGKRDRCCSRYGLTLYQALAGHVGDAAWQCTHLGGHRYAPTLVTFPDGAYYGRLTPSDLVLLVQAQSLDELLLTHLRGRCCYDDVIQAADFYLRQRTGLRPRDAYRLLDVRLTDENFWTVRFGESTSGKTHQLAVTRRMSDAARLVSCSPPKFKSVVKFRLISLRTES